MKISQDKSNIGKVFTFRIVESSDSYYLCKTLDAEKKSKNIIAVLPKALINKYFTHALSTLEDCLFEGLVLQLQEEGGLPVISCQQDLIHLKEQIPKSNDDLSKASSFIGLVSSVDRKGVTLRFFDGLKKLVLVKDLETSDNFA